MQCFSTTPHPRGAASAGQTSSASDADVADVGRGRPAEGEYVFPVGGQEKRILPEPRRRRGGGDGESDETVPGTVPGTVIGMVLVMKMPA